MKATEEDYFSFYYALAWAWHQPVKATAQYCPVGDFLCCTRIRYKWINTFQNEWCIRSSVSIQINGTENYTRLYFFAKVHIYNFQLSLYLNSCELPIKAT